MTTALGVYITPKMQEEIKRDYQHQHLHFLLIGVLQENLEMASTSVETNHHREPLGC